MTDDIIIAAENISKVYRTWSTPAARLISPIMAGAARTFLGGTSAGVSLQRRAEGSYRDFYAIKDISFQLRRGESMGIIGRNGSGKSTLLQILAGTLTPSAGSFKVNGRVAALLELGSGFNPEFTGRENVFLNGAILGLSRKEVEARFDAMAAFADIGDFMDQPTKTYSSGMLVRLAFAVAVSVEPDILIVDEALSVGDIFFQQKCFKRVREMLDNGVSLLFVSHETAAVQNLCDRAILLFKGEKAFEGTPEEAASRYYAQAASGVSLLRNETKQVESERKSEIAALLAVSDIRHEAKSEHGIRDLEVSRVGIFDLKSNPVRTFTVGSKMRVVVELSAVRDVLNPSSGIHLYDRMNNLVFAAGTRQLKTQFADFSAGEKRLVEFILELAVHPGSYTLSVGGAQGSDEPNVGHVQHRLEGLGPIDVIPSGEGTWPFYGIARLPLNIEVHG